MTEMQENAEKAADFLRFLANPNRLMILCMLMEGERCAGELEEQLNISQSALSQHLALMREGDIIESRKEAQKVFYSIKDGGASEILGVLYELYCKGESTPCQ